MRYSYVPCPFKVPLNNWAIFYAQRCTGEAEELVSAFNKLSGPMGVKVGRPRLVPMKNDYTDTYVRSIHQQVTSEVCQTKTTSLTNSKLVLNLVSCLHCQRTLLNMCALYPAWSHVKWLAALGIGKILFCLLSLLSAAWLAAGGVRGFWQQRRSLRRHQEGLLRAESHPVPGLELSSTVCCSLPSFSCSRCYWPCNFSSGGERADNFPATKAKKCRANDSHADERQVGRRAVDHQRASGVCDKNKKKARLFHFKLSIIKEGASLILLMLKSEQEQKECCGSCDNETSVVYRKGMCLTRNSWWSLELMCIMTQARGIAQSWVLLPVWTGKRVESSDIHRWVTWLKSSKRLVWQLITDFLPPK